MARADLAESIDVLRRAGARFCFRFGSTVTGTATASSDVDLAAWWGGEHPSSWDLALPGGVDLVVLDDAPLWLAGRVAQEGRLLFDDDPRARVAWQAETRLRYLDDLPQLRQARREWTEAVARGR